MSGFVALLDLARGVFTAPGFAIFTDLVGGWVCAPGRRTITAMIAVADPLGRRAHDAYHRFVRDGAWHTDALWRVLTVHAIGRFAPAAVVELACDDTLFHHEGRNVEGAGVFPDAVRSTLERVVYARGLNLVVITLRIDPPWGGRPIAVPVNVRLHRKHDPTTTVAHAAAMIAQITAWLPDRVFHLCADGAYATLAGAGLPRTQVTSRTRRDAALYEPAPPLTGRRGRPRMRGERLPTPPELATGARKRDWKKVTIDVRGKTTQRLGYVRDVLWYRVNKHDLVRLVIVRDPDGIEPDDFFFTTDLNATGAEVVARYAGRWAIEVAFRDAKQDLGAQNPQSWKRQGPERAATLPVATRTHLVLVPRHPPGRAHLDHPSLVPVQDDTPSFLDALAALRRILWSQRITAMSRSGPDQPKITQALLDTLAYAA